LAGMICNYIADDERRALLFTIIALSRVVEVTGAGIIS